MERLSFTCKSCAGVVYVAGPNEGESFCRLCLDYNQTFDQATKTCKNCSTPGLVTVDTSGWTKTTYPVETCTPCDATKNEYAKKDGKNGNGTTKYTCTTCPGTIGLADISYSV